MTIQLKLDRVDLLSCQEKYGVIMRLERKAYISGLAGETDYKILLTALDDAGLPVSGADLDRDGLVLTERNPTIIDKDKAEVVLIYEHYFNEGQSYDSPPTGPFVGETRASLQQITTNKDENGDLIELSHTYPADDPNYPGETKIQVGELSIYVPQKTLSLRGVKISQAPWLIANAIVGKLNRVTWAQGAARSWMCMMAGWRNMDPSTGANRYYMTFEFQHNPDGWDRAAVFIDENTNRPPPDVVDGVGYKVITYLGEVDFNSTIGTYIQGG